DYLSCGINAHNRICIRRRAARNRGIEKPRDRLVYEVIRGQRNVLVDKQRGAVRQAAARYRSENVDAEVSNILEKWFGNLCGEACFAVVVRRYVDAVHAYDGSLKEPGTTNDDSLLRRTLQYCTGICRRNCRNRICREPVAIERHRLRA